jgi:hypothetical protein
MKFVFYSPEKGLKKGLHQAFEELLGQIGLKNYHGTHLKDQECFLRVGSLLWGERTRHKLFEKEKVKFKL